MPNPTLARKTVQLQHVAAKYVYATAVSASPSAPLNPVTKLYDTHNAVTTGANWRFIAPVAGVYRVSWSAYFGALGNVFIYKNGVSDTYIGASSSAAAEAAAAELYLNANEYIDLRPLESVTLNNAGGQIPFATQFIAISSVDPIQS